MCGIIGYVGEEGAAPMLLNGIKRLEYRGYDSVGMAVIDEGSLEVLKDVGTVDEVNEKVNFLQLKGDIGIAHTRWATHGGVTKLNAHPHVSKNRKMAAVHNGILENYESLKKALQNRGFDFVSETDSEIVPHYIESKLEDGKNTEEAIRNFMDEAEGTFAILLIRPDEKKIYALRRDSPLALGIGKDENYIASDIYAFSDKTNKAIFFDNDEYAVISKDRFEFFDNKGNKKQKEIKEFLWVQEDAEKKEYDHYMMKEIKEEPHAIRRLLLSLENEQSENFKKLADLIRKSRKVIFVAAGTSYHATLLGVYYLHKCGIDAQTLIASEFEHFALLDENSLVIAFSQSGETMDVIDALSYAKDKRSRIAAVVNVPYSAIQRLSEISISICAGQEICVASTKAFVNQVALLLKLAEEFGFKVDLGELPEKIEKVFDFENKIKNIAKEISGKKDLYVLGRGLSYPVAREIALKIKEVSYIHAEGMMGGELKHGTIALIEEGTPVISLVSNGDSAMISNTKEVQARGARAIIIGSMQGDIVIDTENDGTFGILATVVGQLLAYHIAKEKGLPIDRPRNLAKCVTVR